MAKKIGIWGWWQGGNLGDNWILETMTKIFGPASVPINTSVLDFSGFDFVVCGGGGLFVHNIPEPWNKPIPVPYGVFGVGTEFGVNHEEAKRLFSSSHFFFVRDNMTLKKMGFLDDEHLVMADVTFFDPLPTQNNLGNKVLFVWRDNDFDNVLYGKKVWKDYIGDYISANDWKKEISSVGEIKNHSFDTSKNEINNLMKDVGLVISQRYHGIVAAIQTGTPCIALDICPKIRAIMEDVGLNDFCLKIGEIKKFKELYSRCLDEREGIRIKMAKYKNKSFEAVKDAAEIAKNKIRETLK